MSYLGNWTKITTKLPPERKYVIAKCDGHRGYGARIMFYVKGKSSNHWFMPTDNDTADVAMITPTHWRFYPND